MLDIVIKTTTWTATMIVETIVDVLSTLKTAQTGNALIPMEAGVGQLALK